jgi:hypothetical protein
VSRRIDTGSAEPTDAGKKPLYLGKRKGGDDYLGRLAKYIPTEIVGLYLATSAAIPRGPHGEPRSQIALWIIFALSFALVPVYFVFATTRDKKKALWPQVVLASIAFPVWVFAIGGPFEHLGWYQGWIATVTLAFTTVAFGFYKPAPGA